MPTYISYPDKGYQNKMSRFKYETENVKHLLLSGIYKLFNIGTNFDRDKTFSSYYENQSWEVIE